MTRLLTSVVAMVVLATAETRTRFLSLEEGLKLFVPTTSQPNSMHCPAGASVPVEASFTRGRIFGVKLWKETKQGWLRKSESREVVGQAIDFVAKGRSTVTDSAVKIRGIIRVPCGAN